MPLPFAHLPNAWLLFALLLQVLTYPSLDDYRAGRAAIAVFDLVILVLALRASRAGGDETSLGCVLVVPAMVLHAGGALGEEGSVLSRSACNDRRKPEVSSTTKTVGSFAFSYLARPSGFSGHATRTVAPVPVARGATESGPVMRLDDGAADGQTPSQARASWW